MPCACSAVLVRSINSPVILAKSSEYSSVDSSNERTRSATLRRAVPLFSAFCNTSCIPENIAKPSCTDVPTAARAAAERSIPSTISWLDKAIVFPSLFIGSIISDFTWSGSIDHAFIMLTKPL